METSSAPESFRGLLLRHRGRTGLIQRDLAARAGVSRGAVQDWEAGLNYPTAERLQVLTQVLCATLPDRVLCSLPATPDEAAAAIADTPFTDRVAGVYLPWAWFEPYCAGVR